MFFTSLCVYFSAIVILSIYGFHRSTMLWSLWSQGYSTPPVPEVDTIADDQWPLVCVQLPLYNESAVAGRLLSACAALSYPRDRFEIQVLDDSTDTTVSIVDATVGALKRQYPDLNIETIRREERTEFKAGALKEGMQVTRAKYLAVFDADFVPEPGFLKATMAHFVHNPDYCFVQARWGHLNRDESWLTRAQAVLLDGHFVIEHAARSFTSFFNFNGTGGIWNREAIEDAGGWQGDTLTEDLDLSYRAHLKGWKACYLRDVVCMAELPATITAFKGQQFRWMKGGAQVAKKLMPQILRSSLPLRHKVEAFFHLTAHICYTLMVLTSLLMVPLVHARAQVYDLPGFWFELLVFLFTFVSMVLFYGNAQLMQKRGASARMFVDILAAILLGIGISWHCARASLSGFLGSVGVFVRTPKRGDQQLSRIRRPKFQMVVRGLNRYEGLMGLYLLAGVVYAATESLYLTVPFIALFCGGYLFVGMSEPDETSA